MKVVNTHEAKTHLSKFIEQVVKGESIVIAKSGKPLVKLVRLEAPEHGQRRRVGFLAGQLEVPDDFDRMGQEEIERLFFGDA
jgi:prevent-host-death family protein